MCPGGRLVGVYFIDMQIRNAALLCCTLGLHAQTRPVTKAQFAAWMKECSNWGRWGKSDELGTLNLLTPATRLKAARLVREGVAISLSHDVEKEKAPDVASPFVHQMRSSSDNPGAAIFTDSFSVAPHGIAHTHLDALCHFSYEGSLYNGFSIKQVTSKGAARLSIEAARTGIFARGILIDIPELKGVPYLEPGEAIYPEDLDAWEKKTGVRVQSGDIVFIRTGRWARRIAKGPWSMAERAGLHASSVVWLHQRDIAILGSDASSDVRPSQVEDVPQPVHTLVIVAMGTPIFRQLRPGTAQPRGA